MAGLSLGDVFLILIAVWIGWALLNRVFDGRPRRALMSRAAREAEDAAEAVRAMTELTQEQWKIHRKRKWERDDELIRRWSETGEVDSLATVYIVVSRELLAGKVGITETPRQRRDHHAYYDWEMVDEWSVPQDGLRDTERTILAWIRQHSPSGPLKRKMPQGGHTEAWLLSELPVRAVWDFIEALLGTATNQGPT